MLIRDITIANFLSHESTYIDISPLTVLVGPCNSGKSAIFDALLNFAMLAKGKIADVFAPGPYSFHATRRRQSAANGHIGFEMQMAKAQGDRDSLQYTISYRQEMGDDPEDPKFEILSERLIHNGADKAVTLYDRSTGKLDPALQAFRHRISSDSGLFTAVRSANTAGSQSPQIALLLECAHSVSRIRKYRLQSHYLRQPTFVGEDEGPIWLSPNGNNLAGVLYQLSRTEPDRLDQIKASVQRVVVGFIEFAFNQTRSQDIGLSMRFSDGRGTVSAARLSDGTLHFLGLATLLLSDSKPSVVCLEEPEIGLNSAAMRELVRLLRQTSTNPAGPTQILVSTHSPFLLRELWRTGVDNPLDAIKYVQIENGRSRVMAVGALNGLEHFDASQPSIAFAAKVLDGLVNTPDE